MGVSGQFTALVVDKGEEGVFAELREMESAALPKGDVTVAVTHSSLNYKDGMILQGVGGMVKIFPHIPGIDFAGLVESSDSPDFKPGDPVVLTGWRVGEVRWGGYATRARVKAEWLVPLPEGLTLARSMAIGTAGLSAMLAIMALERDGLTPEEEGKVLVTGAAGGVGSVAVALLHGLGYTVAASTGRKEEHDYLRALGADVIIERSALEEKPKGPLDVARWRAAIDNVGGSTLAHILASLQPGGACAAVGLAAGAELHTTVIPFLLRGVNLLGIDSAFHPLAGRREAWARLAAELPLETLDSMTRTVRLADLPALASDILRGRVRGRTVVEVAEP